MSFTTPLRTKEHPGVLTSCLENVFAAAGRQRGRRRRLDKRHYVGAKSAGVVARDLSWSKDHFL